MRSRLPNRSACRYSRVFAYGLTPYFTAYPGTVSLRQVTYLALIEDVLDSLARAGFRRIVLCNGHGGNAPAGAFAIEWMARTPGCTVRFHNWWSAPQTMAQVQRTDPVASHASWMENFPWTRLPNRSSPADAKPMTDPDRLRLQNPAGVRTMLGDGNYGGLYRRPDDEMLAIWDVAVAETRALIEGPWR